MQQQKHHWADVRFLGQDVQGFQLYYGVVPSPVQDRYTRK